MLLINEYNYSTSHRIFISTFAVLFLQRLKRKCYVAQHASKFGNYYHTYIFNSQLFLWNATNIMNSYHCGWRSNQSRGMWYLFANKSKLKYLKMRKFSFSSMATESYPIIQCMCKTYFIIFIIIFTHFSYLFMCPYLFLFIVSCFPWRVGEEVIWFLLLYILYWNSELYLDSIESLFCTMYICFQQ